MDPSGQANDANDWLKSVYANPKSIHNNETSIDLKPILGGRFFHSDKKGRHEQIRIKQCTVDKGYIANILVLLERGDGSQASVLFSEAMKPLAGCADGGETFLEAITKRYPYPFNLSHMPPMVMGQPAVWTDPAKIPDVLERHLSIVDAKPKLVPGKRTSLIYRGPGLNSPDQFGFVSLSRIGNHFDITLELHQFYGRLAANVVTVPLTEISLGTLEKGKYQVTVHLEHYAFRKYDSGEDWNRSKKSRPDSLSTLDFDVQ